MRTLSRCALWGLIVIVPAVMLAPIWLTIPDNLPDRTLDALDQLQIPRLRDSDPLPFTIYFQRIPVWFEAVEQWFGYRGTYWAIGISVFLAVAWQAIRRPAPSAAGGSRLSRARLKASRLLTTASRSLLGFSFVLLLVYFVVTPRLIQREETAYQVSMSQLRDPEQEEREIRQDVEKILRDWSWLRESEADIDSEDVGAR